MANRNCHGYWFRVGSASYYECFWDGTLIDETKEKSTMQGGYCPHCQRKIMGTNCGLVPIQTKVARQAMLPTGRVVTFESVTRTGE